MIAFFQFKTFCNFRKLFSLKIRICIKNLTRVEFYLFLEMFYDGNFTECSIWNLFSMFLDTFHDLNFIEFSWKIYSAFVMIICGPKMERDTNIGNNHHIFYIYVVYSKYALFEREWIHYDFEILWKNSLWC